MKGESRASRLFGFRSVHDIDGAKFYTDIIERALLLVSERQSSVISLPPAADRSGDDGRDVYYRSFLIYAWDVLFWLS